MYRKIEDKLKDWKESRMRKPLVIQGARQVGKTYSVLMFAKKNFQNIVYINFESSSELHRMFDRDLNPERIVRDLSVFTGETIRKESTLIFFDEIQACPAALTSLKYFSEEAPGYAVIAAGSLLGVAINSHKSSFPVGKVRMLTMYPLDFEEFLIADRGPDAAAGIKESFRQFKPCPLHETFTDIFRTYVFTGGMPAVVKEYLESSDSLMADIVKKEISDAYIADMAKYAGREETVRIIESYRSLPAQMAKDNRKFQYKVIKSGGRAVQYASAIEWLRSSGIVIACHRVSEGCIPLSGYADPTAFKLYHCDTGLLSAMTAIPAKEIISEAGSGFRGALAENSAAAALTASGYSLFYWESKGRAEIDFLIQKEGKVIPVEIKASENVRSRSLSEYISRYSPPYAMRISEKNFGNENNIRSIPFYALFCI